MNFRKDVPTQIPRTCEYVTLHGKRDLGMMKAKENEMGDYLGLFGWI